MEAVAKLRGCPLSARKMRMVLDLIRGKQVNDALNILRYTNREAATFAEKTVLSAIANWENKIENSGNADDYDLYIKEVYSGEGPVLKRFRPAPHGRAHRIRKKTNHVTVIVANQKPLSDAIRSKYEKGEEE
jgi:large subunit ribosomal protein L22